MGSRSPGLLAWLVAQGASLGFFALASPCAEQVAITQRGRTLHAKIGLWTAFLN
jgi:hypothetical protein